MADTYGGPTPDGFECPITQEVMVNPMVTADGHSYECAEITRWLTSNNTAPATGDVLATRELTPNVALRKAIAEWRGRQPLALDTARLTLNSDVVLGAGSFGRVVAGELLTHGRPQLVAVKTLPEMTRAEQKVQFERELVPHIRAMQAADGVCRVLGTCEKDGRLCLVMRHYERSLADALAQHGTLPPADVRRYGLSLARTLAQLHAAGLVLQDIKPENVLLDAHDSPVYADFGISAVLTCTGLMPSSLKGTFNYMAPEAFEPPLGPAADVWSLACVLLELTTGVRPWGGLQMQQIMWSVMRRNVPKVPDTMVAAVVLRRCFAFAAADRPTAAELAVALEEDGREAADRQATELAQLQAQLNEERRLSTEAARQHEAEAQQAQVQAQRVAHAQAEADQMKAVAIVQQSQLIKMKETLAAQAEEEKQRQRSAQHQREQQREEEQKKWREWLQREWQQLQQLQQHRTFRCVKRAVLRRDKALGSATYGYLEEGTQIEGLEFAVQKDRKTGVDRERVRCQYGWVSMLSNTMLPQLVELARTEAGCQPVPNQSSGVPTSLPSAPSFSALHQGTQPVSWFSPLHAISRSVLRAPTVPKCTTVPAGHSSHSWSAAAAASVEPVA